MSLWNTTFDQTTRWSRLGFVNMFIAAYNERLIASGQATGVNPPIVPYVAGQVVQGVGFFTTLSGCITRMQGVPYNYYLDPALTYDGTSILSGAGGPGGLPIYSLATLGTKLGYDPRCWRRKRPREILSLTDAADLQGNPAIAGQRAWAIGTNSATYHVGSLYQYNGAGAGWVQADPAAGSVDILDSNLASPNTVKVIGPLSNLFFHQVGDYIGPWIWNQLRDVFNACVWRWDYLPRRRDDGLFLISLDSGVLTCWQQTTTYAHTSDYYFAGPTSSVYNKFASDPLNAMDQTTQSFSSSFSDIAGITHYDVSGGFAYTSST